MFHSRVRLGGLRPDGPPHRPLRQEREAGLHARALRAAVCPGWVHPHLWVLRLQRGKAGEVRLG